MSVCVRVSHAVGLGARGRRGYSEYFECSRRALGVIQKVHERLTALQPPRLSMKGFTRCSRRGVVTGIKLFGKINKASTKRLAIARHSLRPQIGEHHSVAQAVCLHVSHAV